MTLVLTLVGGAVGATAAMLATRYSNRINGWIDASEAPADHNLLVVLEPEELLVQVAADPEHANGSVLNDHNAHA